jgi:hypothetical protein
VSIIDITLKSERSEKGGALAEKSEIEMPWKLFLEAVVLLVGKAFRFC